MRNTREDAEQTIRALLDAALKVFSREGYAAARLEDVAKEAGVTRGAIYRIFGSKPALFSRLVEETAEDGQADLAQAVRVGGSTQEILRNTLVGTLHRTQTDTRFREAVALMQIHTGDPSELAALHRARADQQIRQVTALFEQARVQRKLRPGLDPMVAARAFIAYQDGLVAACLANPAGDIPQNAEQLADIFVRGIEE
jgi:TetR/AcrR family transcriptional regulator, acrAB operon repressor